MVVLVSHCCGDSGYVFIGERSEPLSRVFNDQPRDIYIYIWPMSDRTYEHLSILR